MTAWTPLRRQRRRRFASMHHRDRSSVMPDRARRSSWSATFAAAATPQLTQCSPRTPHSRSLTLTTTKRASQAVRHLPSPDSSCAP
eukprot:5114322-Prymnesium_polylepis.1